MLYFIQNFFHHKNTFQIFYISNLIYWKRVHFLFFLYHNVLQWLSLFLCLYLLLFFTFENYICCDSFKRREFLFLFKFVQQFERGFGLRPCLQSFSSLCIVSFVISQKVFFISVCIVCLNFPFVPLTTLIAWILILLSVTVLIIIIVNNWANQIVIFSWRNRKVYGLGLLAILWHLTNLFITLKCVSIVW